MDLKNFIFEGEIVKIEMLSEETFEEVLEKIKKEGKVEIKNLEIEELEYNFKHANLTRGNLIKYKYDVYKNEEKIKTKYCYENGIGGGDSYGSICFLIDNEEIKDPQKMLIEYDKWEKWVEENRPCVVEYEGKEYKFKTRKEAKEWTNENNFYPCHVKFTEIDL